MPKQPRCLHCFSSSPDPCPRSTRTLELLPEGNGIPIFRDDEERIELLGLRNKLSQETESIEARLESMQKEYTSLLKRKATIRRDRVVLGLIFKPIRRFPTDILQNIFIMARDSLAVRPDAYAPAFIQDSLPKRSFNTTPWNVSQVCQRWRDVSLSFPHLWSYFGIDLRKRTRGLSENLLSLVALQFARARGRDLHFSLQCNEATTSLLPAMIPYCIGWASGWKCLELTMPKFAFLDSFKILVPLLNNLESLHIQVHDRNASGLGSTVFKDAIQLKEVIGSSYDISRLGLPWKQLERLILNPGQIRRDDRVWEPSLRKLWREIKKSPLQILVIRHWSLGHFQWGGNPQETNTLASLRTLVTESWTALLILSYIVTPQLQSLYVHAGNRIERDIVVRFIRRSSPPPLRLTLELREWITAPSQGQGQGRIGLYPLEAAPREDPTEHMIRSLQSVSRVSQIHSQSGTVSHLECLVDCAKAPDSVLLHSATSSSKGGRGRIIKVLV